jgi:hypothetical protein
MHVMLRRGRLIALSLAAAIASPPAGAAGPCYPRDAIHAHLAERYGERPVGAGVTAGQLVELLVRPDGASWTILVIRPDGLACPVAAGEDWTGASAPTPERGESSS